MAVDKTNLNPLPVGTTTEGTLTTSPDTLTTAPAVQDFSDPVEAWVNDNPTFEEPAATTEVPAPPADPAAPPAPAPVADPAQPTQPAPVQPDQAPTVTAPPADAPGTQPAAQPGTQPAAKTYAPDEKFGLADGVEWTRAQIVQRLQEFTQLEPRAKEAEAYSKLFGMPAAQAVENWGPVLQRLASEPNTTAFLDSYLSNPEKASYLETCAAHYDRETAGQPPAQPSQPTAAQPQPQADPVLAREVAELKAYRDEQLRQQAITRVNTEVEQATQRYPFLATDENMRRDLVLTAQALHAQDSSKGILDALALKAPIYDALLITRNSQPPADPAPVAQPALLGSPGASPGGSRPSNNGRAKSFESTDDGLNDWLQNPPPDFK